ncbi:Leucine-twenty homeobox [Galemys pyrenaicus]|uniref:Leucine-twenty homeobox n=1 Tax=Galemys pyrenaicus TaxID=202257 RepID=A0A8J6DFU1_GALPY|nr:Leucine-twenty homeobox [Galemys pyrenaicus]
MAADQGPGAHAWELQGSLCEKTGGPGSWVRLCPSLCLSVVRPSVRPVRLGFGDADGAPVCLAEKRRASVRRPRTRFSPQQLGALSAAFRETPHPGWGTILQLAASTRLEEAVIQVWFKNQRAKVKRQQQAQTRPGLPPGARRSSSSAREHEDAPSPTSSAHSGSPGPHLGLSLEGAAAQQLPQPCPPQPPAGAGAPGRSPPWGALPPDLQDLCLQASDLPWACAPLALDELARAYGGPGLDEDGSGGLDQYLLPGAAPPAPPKPTTRLEPPRGDPGAPGAPPGPWQPGGAASSPQTDVPRRRPGKQTSARRRRTKFTPEQLEALKDAFQKTTYPSWGTITQLTLTTNLDDVIIQTWFKNQRAKVKKQQLQSPPSQRHPGAPNHPRAGEGTPSPTASANAVTGDLGVSGPELTEAAGASGPKCLGGPQPPDTQELGLQVSDRPWVSNLSIPELIELYVLPGDDDASCLDQYLLPEGSD